MNTYCSFIPLWLFFLLLKLYIPKTGFFASQCLNLIVFSRMTEHTSEIEECFLELTAQSSTSNIKRINRTNGSNEAIPEKRGH